MNSEKYLGLLLVIILVSFTTHRNAYQIFNKKGKKSSYEKILKEVENADIVFFGELHNNPINHWLQLELSQDIFNEVNENLVLGAEMFESDDQIILNEYLGGHLSYNSFKKEAKVWTNNKTDYQPLLDFALVNQLTFVATNIPRRYANMVYKNGFKSLNSINNRAKEWMAPLPIDYNSKLLGYKKIAKMDEKHGGKNLPKAQAIKDATMAHFILKNWKKGQTFIHFNGTYHSNNFEGIIWYLKQNNPNIKVLSISSVEQKNINSLKEENIGGADFTICTPSSMTKTY